MVLPTKPVRVSQERCELMASSRDASNRVIRNQLDKIRKKFRMALERNAKSGELDRLERRDFIVEVERRDDIILSGNRRVAQLEELNRNENLKKDLLADRVRFACELCYQCHFIVLM